MSEQQDPEALFAQTLRQFQARDDGVGGVSFTGEVVEVSAQSRTKSLYATLIVTEGPASGDEIKTTLPYRVRQFAKPPGHTGTGRVEVGQVLKLTGRLAQRDGEPIFSATFLTWVDHPGPYERDRRSSIELLTCDPDYEKRFKYATRWQIAEHPGSLNSIVLITSRGKKGQQDFAGQINRSRPPEQRIEVKYRDVPVQGPRMVDEICQVLYGLTPDQGDMAVIVRGGGGWSDLHGFNDLRLAEAIRDCSIPVVTGIGHRSDRHLADFAAEFAFSVPGEAAIELREGKAIAAGRENKRQEEERRERAARQFTYAQRDDPFVANPGVRSALPASPKPPPAPSAAPLPVPPPLVPPHRPRRWPPPYDMVSVLALIASLLCLGPVALALALVGWYRTRGYRRRGRWAVAVAAILGAVLTIPMLVVGYALIDEARRQPGGCVGTVGSWEQVVNSTVDCDQAHRGEIVYRGDVDAATLRSIRDGRPAKRCYQEISQPTRQMIKRRQFTLRLVLTGAAPHDDDDFVCIATSPRPVRGSLLD